MKPKFELDDDDSACPSARLIDPDAFDASEQQFAASLEQRPDPVKTSFVPDTFVPHTIEDCEQPPTSSHQLTVTEPAVEPGLNQNLESYVPADEAAAHGATETLIPDAVQTDETPSQDLDTWRDEVAARVNNYRARRRPRAPRYPSLQLKFEAYEPARNNPSATAESFPSARAGRQAIALDSALPVPELASPEPVEYLAPQIIVPETTTARILEFPRSSTFMPPQPLDELAEPVFDRPRILEAPEIAPPPPALGGILIEPVEQPASERRPGFEVPLQSAPMSRRLLAVAIDALIVLSALSLFSYIFFRITATVPPLPSAIGTVLTLAGIFWVAYQYLLLVYTGTTAGLKLAQLQLHRFDGSSAPRKIRRWRILASVLSGASLGLGYAWCFLDEDELCWHDRITRTYMAPIQ